MAGGLECWYCRGPLEESEAFGEWVELEPPVRVPKEAFYGFLPEAGRKGLFLKRPFHRDCAEHWRRGWPVSILRHRAQESPALAWAR